MSEKQPFSLSDRDDIVKGECLEATEFERTDN